MAETLAIINLKCPNCGAKLSIDPDMGRFACAYCGSEQIVERRGGTVSLRLVTEAIDRVRAGTDKTAAELALVRLRSELEAAREELMGANGAFDQKVAAFAAQWKATKSVFDLGQVILAVSGIALLIFKQWFAGVVCVTIAGFITWWYRGVASRRLREEMDLEQQRPEFVRAEVERLASVKQQIENNEEIVRS